MNSSAGYVSIPMNRLPSQFIGNINTRYFAKQFITGLLILFVGGKLAGQGQTNEWYFGDRAAIDFNSGSPVVIAGSSIIADAAGNLLFYPIRTGYPYGIKPMLRCPMVLACREMNNLVKQLLLFSDPDAVLFIMYLQPRIWEVVEYPLYPICLIQLYVDMTLNGGNGDVVAGSKNIALLDHSCEKPTAVRNCMGDSWIIAHRWNSDAFYAYRLSSTGLSLTPVILQTGIVNGPTIAGNAFAGCLKASADGKKLLCPAYSKAPECEQQKIVTKAV